MFYSDILSSIPTEHCRVCVCFIIVGNMVLMFWLVILIFHFKAICMNVAKPLLRRVINALKNCYETMWLPLRKYCKRNFTCITLHCTDSNAIV